MRITPDKKCEQHGALNILLAAHGFEDRLLSHKEAAAWLTVSPDTLYTWVSTRRYPLSRVKVGHLNKYWLSELIRFLNERKVGGAV